MSLRAERQKKILRQRRVRAAIRGTADCPRLSVFRSNRHISAQLIDDAAGITLASASDAEMPKSKKKSLSRQEMARWVGERMAKKAEEKGIRKARFDRGPYSYHGSVKALAEVARKGGLKF